MRTMESERTMATETGRMSNYLAAYSDLRARRQEREPVWLGQLRQEAWARFEEKGFPTTHDEDWRFTNLAALTQTPFRRAAKGSVQVSASEIEKFRMAGAACQLVFVNGHFAPELSETANLPAGVEIARWRRRWIAAWKAALRRALSSIWAAMPTWTAMYFPR